MNDIDKLRVLLPHWIEHNVGHGREFRKWGEILDGTGQNEIAELLRRAQSFLMEADAALQQALHLSGGALKDHAHHHDHE